MPWCRFNYGVYTSGSGSVVDGFRLEARALDGYPVESSCRADSLQVEERREPGSRKGQGSEDRISIRNSNGRSDSPWSAGGRAAGSQTHLPMSALAGE